MAVYSVNNGPLDMGPQPRKYAMRKRNQITQLETQVSELMAVVNSLLEVVTKPTDPIVELPATAAKVTVTRKFRTSTKTPRSNMKWTQEEHNICVKLFNNGCSYDEIAKTLNRTERAVASHVQQARRNAK